MRFFVTQNIGKNPTLRVLLIILLSFLSLFWTLNWFYYSSVFGLTPENLKLYFYGPPDFPENISLQALLEDLHITFFINFFLFFLLASLHTALLPGPLHPLVLISFFFLTGEVLFSLIALKGVFFVYLKLMAFFAFQISLVPILLKCWLVLTIGNGNGRTPNRESLKKLVAVFSSFAFLFLALTSFLFFSKFSFSVEAIEVYYRGSEEHFIRPKTLEGLLKILHYHLLGIPLFCFTLAHFLPFAQVKFAGLLGSLALALPLLEVSSGIGVLLLGKFFAYTKLGLFLLSFPLLALLSLLLLKKSLKD